MYLNTFHVFGYFSYWWPRQVPNRISEALKTSKPPFWSTGSLIQLDTVLLLYKGQKSSSQKVYICYILGRWKGEWVYRGLSLGWGLNARPPVQPILRRCQWYNVCRLLQNWVEKFSKRANLIHLFKFWWLPVNNRKSLLQSKPPVQSGKLSQWNLNGGCDDPATNVFYF